MNVRVQPYAWLAAVALIAADVLPKPDRVKATLEGVSRMWLGTLEWFGAIGEFCAHSVREGVTPHYQGRELV